MKKQYAVFVALSLILSFPAARRQMTPNPPPSIRILQSK